MVGTVRVLDGLSNIIDDYDFFFLDIWGVLHDAVVLYPETLTTMAALKDAGKTLCLVSNTSNTLEMIDQELNDHFGLPRELYDMAFTAGSVCHQAIAPFDGQAAWFLGQDRFTALMEGYQILVNDRPKGSDFILNALSGTRIGETDYLYPMLDEAQKIGLPMLCANPDLVVHIGEELVECAGTFAAYYETIGGEVQWFGKPHAPIYQAAWEFAGQPDKSRVLAIGDSVRTDIAGANGFGVDSALNLVGIHRDELLCQNRTDVQEEKLDEMFAGQKIRPQYVLNGFKI